jgi:Flp pilus assembly protein TadG
MIRLLRKLGRDQRGNSFVEMAFITPILATLLVGTIDISDAVSTKVKTEQAAQRAIELAQTASYPTASAMTTAVQNEATAAAGTGSSATASAWAECDHSSTHVDYDTGTCSTGQSYARYVSVTVQNSFTPMFGTSLFPGANADGTVTVKGYAVLRLQ